MHKVVFDTDVFSEILKNQSPSLGHRARAYRAAFGCFTISSITVMEIVYGWRKDGNDEALEHFLEILQDVEVLDFDQSAAQVAGHLNAELDRAGTKIGCEDPLIAAVAIARSLPLVTRNLRHFERVKELAFPLIIEPWA